MSSDKKTIDPPSPYGFFLIGIFAGLLSVAGFMAVPQNIGLGIIGGLVAFGLLYAAYLRGQVPATHQHILILRTASGDTPVLTTTDGNLVQDVKGAIEQAVSLR